MHKEVKNIFGRVFYEIEYKPNENIVEATWHGTASKRDLKEAIAAGLEVHEYARCAFRLNDNTDFSSAWADSLSWIEDAWLARAYELGIRYLAHVARSGSFGEVAGDAMIYGRIGSQIVVKVFSNKADALHWLQARQRETMSEHTGIPLNQK